LKHLDLFSGIGGFALAARWAGIETIAFCEIDPFCRKVLEKNFPNVPIHHDVKKLQAFSVDMITAGFPCQPFSVAGKKKGINDDRYLWPDTMRIIRDCKPTWVILENVPGIIPMLDPILKDLEKEGYDWQAYLIPASAVHAPHKMERLWIVAHRDSERGNYRQERHLQDDWQQYVASLQSEWSQFQPQSWQTFNTQDWLESSSDSTSQRSSGTRPSGESLYSTSSREGKANNAINDSLDSFFGWQEDQPPIPGMDDGLPNGLDRNKALGNAIVPQIPYLFMMMIKELHGQTE
jgi:DNA (cytosine-5)-methyltransferase 1